MNHVSRLSVALLSVGLSISANAMATSPVAQQQLNTLPVKTDVFNASDYVSSDQIKMFPMPDENMKQHIITLPSLSNEDEYMLEIQIGQNKLVDCNRHKLMGEIVQKTVEGWGYEYFQVDKIMTGPSTMMMCTEPKTTQFVMLGESIKENYDSRLPKIYYLPHDTQLRYRVWRAETPFNFSGQ
ncbi:serine protease inhibitor ecotin [Shewanella sp. OMA3-2]|uniref:serine protease inhibitor ecotin n=1 Tax=Shewanella sp. OMA3-2 TaxID=2908650 RepID=UPI001F43E75A|nr:serine protease inhibitor ecotin [Shewanella sp. OMA3-2]UJF20700.1 serine protease inhibitor ecotin [Shewanella sp. OMA3-2]